MEQKNKSIFSLRNINFIISLVIIILALYVVLLPFLPQLSFTFKDALNIQTPLVKAGTDADRSDYPAANTVVIPTLNLQQEVHEGNSEAVLMKGLWHRPQTSSPDKESNTVIAGHRFTYSDPAVFYHLDKVKNGDEIILYWDKKKYIYQVTTVKEVPPNATDVESSTKEPMLTLYTCTPLWSAKNRLVVQAKLLGADQ